MEEDPDETSDDVYKEETDEDERNGETEAAEEEKEL